VLVFHDQPLNDCEPTAFTKSLGNIELNAANNVTRLDQRRLGIEMHDISNLDQHGNMLARDDRRRVQSQQPAMRAAHEALDPQTKSEIEDLVAEHSL
jgi:alpha-ketoglutarate-dependent 2,4-dichlorophenoxyacetate dioxygenase